MFLYYFFLINLIALLSMAWDKWLAREKKRRIPESTLLGLALAGGATGILAGMLIFRHKIRKPRFIFGVPMVLLLHAYLYLAHYQ